MTNIVLERLNQGLIHAMELDENVHLIGEDLLDPYGGAFKVTRGISSMFPNRVLTTPISESGITGLATGMAMRGLRPVVEIMFGDFTTLIFDQIVNHAAKFNWVYNGQVKVPMVVRTPMGGRRGYGPTHSQSLEKFFLGVPGIKVLSPNTLGDPGALLESAIQDDGPVMFMEHKLLYPCRLLEEGRGDLADANVVRSGSNFPTFTISFSSRPRVTLATFGYNFELTRQAVLEAIYEREIFTEIILFSQLSPFDLTAVTRSLSQTHRLITVEEGSLNNGWGAEVCARAIERGHSSLKINRVAGMNLPIANARSLEEGILPGKQAIKQAIFEIADE